MIENLCSIEDVIKQNSALVYAICNKSKNYSEKEDMYQSGIIGLMRAYDNYDASKNVKFSTYAFPYVVGEISKYVRENKSIKMSRDYIKLGRKIKEYINKHLEVRGYEPSISDIANILEIKEEKVIVILESLNEPKSLDDEINKDGKPITLLDVTPNNKITDKDDILDMKDAFKYLSKEEQNLLINRYYKDLTQSEIAELMGVNQVYVSRLEKKALTKMYNRMSM